ncbi:MAG: S8 family serine peptidase [Armatimonadota bacterium]|nr:S8 family serine peptidase [Armatimonadota bacterium]MDR7445257.1 S8 family serine peptidase [Armatimonadota bacterium]MDR7614759.1 S8 family serine peptidase [Armatimonadota bacterium]
MPTSSAAAPGVRVVSESVGFEGGGHTAAVEPGRPLRGRILVEADHLAEVVARWQVDGEVVGETRVRLESGRKTLLSPPLPTGKPGRYVLDVSIEGARTFATSYTVKGKAGPDRVPDEVVALLDPSEGLPERVAVQSGLLLLRAHALPSTGEVLATYRVPPGLDSEAVLERLRKLPGVRSADLVVLLEGAAGGDLRALQYAPALLEVPSALKWTQGRDVPIGLVDTGLDASHPEFEGRVVRAGDVTSSPYEPEVHGTAVAGVIVARQRLVGVAPGSRILAIRACTAVRKGGLEARCRTDDVIRALDLAARSGARIVNVSLGGPPDAVLGWTVQRLLEAGILVVAPAGNGGSNRAPPYPAAVPGVVAVGATDRRDRLDPTSTTGSFLSVVAPGVDILTAFPAGRYLFVSGTSFAAAHVSGAAALLLEILPGLGPKAVRVALERTAQDLGPPGFDPEYGWGRISACRPLELVRRTVRCR